MCHMSVSVSVGTSAPVGHDIGRRGELLIFRGDVPLVMPGHNELLVLTDMTSTEAEGAGEGYIISQWTELLPLKRNSGMWLEQGKMRVLSAVFFHSRNTDGTACLTFDVPGECPAASPQPLRLIKCSSPQRFGRDMARVLISRWR